MALIFDQFPDMARAGAFADRFGGLASVVRLDDVDPFPFELVPPVVYVPRSAADAFAV